MPDQILQELHNWPVSTVSAAALHSAEPIARYGSTQRAFPIASVSKLISSYATLLAIQEGALELDAPLPTNLLGLEDGDSSEAVLGGGVHNKSITIRHLLAHASGIGFQELNLEKPPETRRIYSSAAFVAIARCVEYSFADVGFTMNFSDYVQEAVCKPLGMKADVTGHPGHGYIASVEDLILLVQEFLNPQLLSEELWEEALTPQFPTLSGIVPGYGRFSPCDWGLGYELHGQKAPHWQGNNMPTDCAGHFGMTGTFLWFHRGTQRAAIVLTDEPFGTWAKPLWQDFNTQLWEALNSV